MSKLASVPLFDRRVLHQAALDAVTKLAPHKLVRNPVMFVTGVVAAVVTAIFFRDLLLGRPGLLFTVQIALWLWITVLFANFAEAVAEGRGRAQAATLRRARSETLAKRLAARNATTWQEVPASELKQGDTVLVEAGDLIPSDGDVIEGI